MLWEESSRMFFLQAAHWDISSFIWFYFTSMHAIPGLIPKCFLHRNVAMVKSDKDTRYGLAAVVSHDGMQMPCWAVPSLASFRDHIGEEAYAKVPIYVIVYYK